MGCHLSQRERVGKLSHRESCHGKAVTERALYAATVWKGTPMDPFFIYLLIINAAGLLLMLMDKGKAVRNVWRIPEWFLLTIALLGGSLGSLLGMYLFRHKTKKPAFALGLPAMVCLHLILFFFIF